MKNPFEYLIKLRSLVVGGEGTDSRSRLKLAALLLLIIAIVAVGSYGLGVKYVKSKPAHNGIDYKNQKSDTMSITSMSLEEFKKRVPGGEKGVKWHMNIQKDQLPVIGLPAGTPWHTPEELWEKGIVGLYLPENVEKNRVQERVQEFDNNKPKVEKVERHKQILLGGMLKDI